MPSTGAIAVHLALRLCGEVALFGFGSGSGEQRLPGTATHAPTARAAPGRTGARALTRCDACVPDCAPERGPPRCAKYYGFCVRTEQYLRRDAAPHNLEAEHRWIRALAAKRSVIGHC
jgi:hypothetical protein